MKKLTVNSESRLVNLDLYNRFQDFRPHLYGTESFSPNINSFPNIAYTPLPYRKPFGFDPLELKYKNPNNMSWQTLSNIESVLEGSSLIGITDTYYFWNYQAVQFAKKNKIPAYTVIWCNLPRHISSWLPPYSWITKQVINNTSLFILRNNKAYEFTDSLKIPREKTIVIYPGINLERFTPALNKDNSTVKILYVGGLTKAKGIVTLLKAFSQVFQSIKKIELHIAGSGQFEEMIRNASTELPIKYYGRIDYSQLPEIYRSADIFCSPSETDTLASFPIWREYFSYTLLEAQASGLPIITTKSGGITEEVDCQNGFVAEADVNKLATELSKMINDSDERIRLGKLNRARAEKLFDNKIQATLLESELLKLV
ncbi:MAG: glycosyltransferase family 4 protein [bacterium]|nr:glycosyltransferase family 4 protein [bacterium]